MKKVERLIAALEKANFHAFTHDDKTVKVANGYADKEVAGNYFDGHRIPDWKFGINPKLDAIAKRFGKHTEWDNAEVVGIYDN